MASVFKARVAGVTRSCSTTKTAAAVRKLAYRQGRDGADRQGHRERVALRREGLIDTRDELYAEHAARPLDVHLDAWRESLRSKGLTLQHVKLHTSRAARIVSLIKGAKLTDIEAPKPATREGVARAEAELRKWVSSSRSPT